MNYTVEELYTYVIIEKPQQIMNMLVAPMAGDIGLFSIPDVVAGGLWDGSVATKFLSGAGTTASDPFLITSGSELAYLAQQVNGGETYAGRYFQLTNDIDLNNIQWTPIGSYSRSFRGIFDGAGHTISNVLVITKEANTSGYESYGIFGSIGGGSSYAEVKNLEIRNMVAQLGTVASTFSSNSGFHVGFVVGTMYNDSRVLNCIVRDSNIRTVATLTSASTAQIFLGGIAGSVGTSTSTDPGNGHRYSIQNCYVSADIRVMITSAIANSLYFSSGGIVGRIRMQPVWPENCMYKGTIHTNSTTNNAAQGGYIGPIFGSLVGTSNPVNPNSANNANADDIIFSGTTSINGTTAPTMTSYYTAYTAKTTSFTSSSTNNATTTNSTAYRIATGNSTMARFQGVNKGTYVTNNTTEMTNMLNRFNNHSTASNVTWKADGLHFTFRHKHHTTVARNGTTVSTSITNEYGNPSYTYKWYINGVLQSGSASSFPIPFIRTEDYNITVVTRDGSYYGAASIKIAKTFDLKFSRNFNTLTATLIGESSITNDPNLRYQWYRINRNNGQETAISGANSLVISNITNDYNYKLVVTSILYQDVSLQRKYEPVYINDTEADWNYYTGLNYVESSTGTIPSGANQNIYNNSNLVKVQLNYSGADDFDNDLYVGTVSLTEKESDFVYYKYYPVVAGKVKIELIDNPFTNRPNGKGFNGWVCEDNVGTVSVDHVLYKRYIELNATRWN